MGACSYSLLCAQDMLDLSKHNPFLPPGYKAQPEQPQQPTQPPVNMRALELRGIMKWGGQWQFNIFDGAKKKSAWITLGDTHAPFNIVAFDETERTITLRDASQTHRIALKKPSATPVKVEVREEPASETDNRERRSVVRRRPIPNQSIEERLKSVPEPSAQLVEALKQDPLPPHLERALSQKPLPPVLRKAAEQAGIQIPD